MDSTHHLETRSCSCALSGGLLCRRAVWEITPWAGQCGDGCLSSRQVAMMVLRCDGRNKRAGCGLRRTMRSEQTLDFSEAFQGLCDFNREATERSK